MNKIADGAKSFKMGEVEDRWENPAIATVTLPGSLDTNGRYLQNHRYVYVEVFVVVEKFR